jgi:hypothetical protein
MTTTASSTSVPFDQFVKLSDQFTEIGSKVGKLYLDGYESAVSDVTDFQRKLAEQSKIESVGKLVNAQADLVSDLTKASVAATRKVLA